MGRQVKEKNLSTREARKALVIRSEPYWRNEGEGQHIGYYRGKRVGKWVARYRQSGSGKGYSKLTIGQADDRPGIDGDGEKVLSWKQAKASAQQWFRQMDAADGIKFGPYSVADALDDYMDAFAGKDRKNTQRRIDVLIKPALGHIEASKLSTTKIRSWHLERANTPARLRTAHNAGKQNHRELVSDEDHRKRKSTANRDLTVLKAALNQAYQNARIASDDAWRRVKPFANVERSKLRYLQDEEARRLVNVCPADFRAIVQATLLTGARYQELAKARVTDFDPNSGTFRIDDAKSNKARVCYLEHEGQSLFEQQCIGKVGADLIFPREDGVNWKDSQQIRRLNQACSQAKIEPRATFHDLRRTFGARLARKGVSMAVIAEALGHADERITRKHYAHLAPNYVANEIRNNASGLGIFRKDSTLERL